MSAAKGPGPVAAVHRILIATALVSALCYTAFALRNFFATGDPGAAALALLAFIASVGIAIYLWSLRGLAAKLTPQHRRE